MRQAGNFDLFQQVEQQREDKHLKLLETVHHVNHKYGGNVLSVCGVVNFNRLPSRTRFNYPMMECS